jgi:hypothetical protein
MATAPKRKGQAKDHQGSTGSGRGSNPSRTGEDPASGVPRTGPPEPARKKPTQDRARALSSPKPEHESGPGIGTDLRSKAQSALRAGGTNSPRRAHQPATHKDQLTPHGHVESSPAPAPASDLPLNLLVLIDGIRGSLELNRTLIDRLADLIDRQEAHREEIGHTLIDAFAQVQGDWESYLVKEFGMTSRSAQRFITTDALGE